MEGVEPPRLAAVDFESTTSAIPSHTRKIVDRGRIEYLQHVSRLVRLYHASVDGHGLNQTVLWNHPEPRTPCYPSNVCLIPLHGQKW